MDYILVLTLTSRNTKLIILIINSKTHKHVRLRAIPGRRYPRRRVPRPAELLFLSRLISGHLNLPVGPDKPSQLI